MTGIIDELFIKFGLKTDDVDKGLQQLGSKLDSGLKSLATRVVAPLAAALSAQKLFSNYIQEADALGKFADRMGSDIEQVFAWGNAVEQAGGSADGFRGTLENLNMSLTEIATKGTNNMATYFDKLGVATVDANGKARDSFDVLTDLAGSIEGMSKQESSGMLKKLGIDSGTIALLQQGKLNLLEVLQVQKDLGTYTKEDAETTAKFNSSLKNLETSIKTAFLPILRQVTPYLSEGLKLLTQGFILIREHQQVLIPLLIGLAVVIMTTVVPALVAMAAAFLATPIGQATAALLLLGLVLEDFLVWLEGGESALSEFWEMFGSAEEVKAELDDLLSTVQEGFNDFFAFVDAHKADIRAFFKVVFDLIKLWIKMSIEQIKFLIDVILLIIGASKAASDGIIDGLTTAANIVKNIWEGVFNWFADKFNTLAGWIDSAKGFVASLGLDFGGGGDNQQTMAVATSGAGGANTNVKNDTSVSVGQVTVTTQATDAKGIANDMAGATKNAFGGLVAVSDSGVNQK